MKVLLVLVVASILSLIVNSLKISHVSVLLPYHGKGMNLVASGISRDSCVQWSIDNSDFVTLHSSPCSSIASITPSSQIPTTKDTRRSAMVTATIRGTSTRVRCEVFVAELKNITMLTTMKRLVVGEAETLRVQGRDSEENVFTSLKGIHFSWKKENDIISLLDKSDPSIHLEQENYADDIMWGAIIAKGLQVGKINIMVYVDSSTPYYNQMQLGHTVEFNVLDNIEITPKVRKFVPHSKVQLNAFRSINGERIEEITTNSMFAWRICKDCDPSIGTVSSTGVFHAKKVGRTEVEIYQRGFEYNSAHAFITVVSAKALRMNLKQMDNVIEIENLRVSDYNLVVNRRYEGTWYLVDHEDEELYWPSNFEVTWDKKAGKDMMRVTKSSLNIFEFETLSKSGSLNMLAALETDPSIQFNADFAIYNQVKHSGPIIIPPHQNEQLFPSGGSGKYSVYILENVGSAYKILNSSPLKIDSNSLTVYGTSVFNTSLVYVCDSLNYQNGQFIQVEIAESGLVFVKNTGDVPLNSEICVTVHILTKSGRPFTSFRHHLQFNEKTDFFIEENYYADKQMKCFRAAKKGIAEITVREKHSNLNQLFHLSAYLPLSFDDQQTTSVLSLGMVEELTLVEGPEKWDRVGVYSHLQDSIDESNTVKLLSKDNRKFTVQCIQTGIHTINFETKHTIPIQDSIATTVKISRKIECYHPSETEIEVVEQQVQQGKVYVRTNDIVNLKLLVFIRDNLGNRVQLHRLDHLNFKWTLNKNFAQIIKEELNTLQLKILGGVGDHNTVRGEIASYRLSKSITKEYNYLDDKHIGSSLVVNVANKISIQPKNFVLYQYAPQGVTLKASGGSGSYQFSMNSSSHAALDLKQVGDNTVMLKVLDPSLNHFHFVSVYVNDPYFEDGDASNGLITSIGQITIQGQSYLEEDDSSIFSLQVFDRYGNLFPEEQIQYMDLQLSVIDKNQHFVTIKQQTHDTFKVIGIKSGKVQLVATSKCNKQSPLHTLIVYPPLKISPSYIRLLVGASYGLSVQGGIDHMNKALSVQQQSIVDLVSPTTVRCLAVGKSDVTVGKVSATVECVDLASVRIPDQLTLFAGNEVYISPIGITATGEMLELTHMQSKQLSFSFRVENANVATVVQSNQLSSSIVKGLGTGSTTITLKATFNRQAFTSVATVTVYDRLFILEYPQKELIVPPNGHIQLKTNYDTENLGQTRYSVQNAELASVSVNGNLMAKSITGYSSVKVETPTASQVKLQKFSVEVPQYLLLSTKSNILLAKNKYGEEFATITGLSISVTSNDASFDSQVDYETSKLNLFSLSDMQSDNVCIKIVSDNSVPFYYIVERQQQQQQKGKQTNGNNKQQQYYLHPGDMIKVATIQSVENGLRNVDSGYIEATQHLSNNQFINTRAFADNTEFNIQISRVNNVKLSQSYVTLSRVSKPTRVSVQLFDAHGNEIHLDQTYNGKIVRKLSLNAHTDPSQTLAIVNVVDSKAIELVPNADQSLWTRDATQKLVIVFDFSVNGKYEYSVRSNPITIHFSSSEHRGQSTDASSNGGKTSFVVLFVTLLAAVLAWYVYMHGSSPSSRNLSRSSPVPTRTTTPDRSQATRLAHDDDDIFYQNREGVQHYSTSKFKPYRSPY